MGHWNMGNSVEKKLVLTSISVLDTIDKMVITNGNDSVWRFRDLEEPYTVVSSDTFVDNTYRINAIMTSIINCDTQLTKFQQTFKIKKYPSFKLIRLDQPDCEKFSRVTVANNVYQP